MKKERIKATIAQISDELTEAAAAIETLSAHAERNRTHVAVATSADVFDQEDSEYYRVPVSYILNALRQWQHDARQAKIEAEKKLEGLV
jgi:hypothetical protein